MLAAGMLANTCINCTIRFPVELGCHVILLNLKYVQNYAAWREPPPQWTPGVPAKMPQERERPYM